MSTKRSILKQLLSYLLSGIILTVPLAATIYILVSVFETIDGVIPVDVPGLGLAIIILVFTFVGFLGSSIIAQPFITYFNKLLERMPLIKTLYSSIKDLLSAFVGQKKSFNQPVLVKMGEGIEMERIGFITNSDLESIGIEGEKVVVYFPHSYAFSGNIFVVPKKNVSLINGKSADMMKFIVSGGVSDVNEKSKK